VLFQDRQHILPITGKKLYNTVIKQFDDIKRVKQEPVNRRIYIAMKGTTMIYKTLHRILNIELHEKPGLNSGGPEG